MVARRDREGPRSATRPGDGAQRPVAGEQNSAGSICPRRRQPSHPALSNGPHALMACLQPRHTITAPASDWLPVPAGASAARVVVRPRPAAGLRERHDPMDCRRNLTILPEAQPYLRRAGGRCAVKRAGGPHPWVAIPWPAAGHSWLASVDALDRSVRLLYGISLGQVKRKDWGVGATASSSQSSARRRCSGSVLIGAGR